MPIDERMSFIDYSDQLSAWIFIDRSGSGSCFSNRMLFYFYQISYSSYLPEIVPSQSLLNGNAKLEVTNGAAQVAGPGIGGYIIQLLTAPIAVFLDAVSFIISFILTLFLPESRVKKEILQIGKASGKTLERALHLPFNTRYCVPY